MNTISTMFQAITLFFTTLMRIIHAVDHAAEMLETTSALALSDLKDENKDKITTMRQQMLEEAGHAEELATKPKAAKVKK